MADKRLVARLENLPLAIVLVAVLVAVFQTPSVECRTASMNRHERSTAQNCYEITDIMNQLKCHPYGMTKICNELLAEFFSCAFPGKNRS